MEAVSVLNDTIKSTSDIYQIGLSWKKNIALPNNYYMTKAQLHALQQKLDRDTNLRERYEETVRRLVQKLHLNCRP